MFFNVIDLLIKGAIRGSINNYDPKMLFATCSVSKKIGRSALFSPHKVMSYSLSFLKTLRGAENIGLWSILVYFAALNTYLLQKPEADILSVWAPPPPVSGSKAYIFNLKIFLTIVPRLLPTSEHLLFSKLFESSTATVGETPRRAVDTSQIMFLSKMRSNAPRKGLSAPTKKPNISCYSSNRVYGKNERRKRKNIHSQHSPLWTSTAPVPGRGLFPFIGYLTSKALFPC